MTGVRVFCYEVLTSKGGQGELNQVKATRLYKLSSTTMVF